MATSSRVQMFRLPRDRACGLITVRLGLLVMSAVVSAAPPRRRTCPSLRPSPARLGLGVSLNKATNCCFSSFAWPYYPYLSLAISPVQPALPPHTYPPRPKPHPPRPVIHQNALLDVRPGILLSKPLHARTTLQRLWWPGFLPAWSWSCQTGLTRHRLILHRQIRCAVSVPRRRQARPPAA